MWLKKLIEKIKNPREKSPHDIIALEKKRLRSESEHHNESNINDNNNNEPIPQSTNQDSTRIVPNREKSTTSTKSNRNRLNSSIDPLSNIDSELNRISSNRSRQQRPRRSSSIISRSRYPVFRDSFGDNDDEELALDNEYLHRTISSRSGRSQGKPSMNHRRSSVEMMRDLSNDERDLESLNLSQSLPEGFNTDNRNW